ncbi:MAG: histidine triad nucleotide-binding protein [Bacillota bacterium]
MSNCLFCKIANGEIPAKKFYEDDEMVIIADINPQAEKHYLLLPKRHFANIIEMNDEEAVILGKCLKTLSKLVDELGLQDGFRLVSNKGAHACQSVGHLHIHILGGNQLADKMA